MYQPAAKLAVVERYFNPSAGWAVSVDIDPSEEGRTGGERKSRAAKRRQLEMIEDAQWVRDKLSELGVHVGHHRSILGAIVRADFVGSCGRRDIIAIHEREKRIAIVEVEGESSGQPEIKLYHAIGQIVIAVEECQFQGFDSEFVLAVSGAGMIFHLRGAGALQELGVKRLAVADNVSNDQWL